MKYSVPVYLKGNYEKFVVCSFLENISCCQLGLTSVTLDYSAYAPWLLEEVKNVQRSPQSTLRPLLQFNPFLCSSTIHLHLVI